jgi:hypothetical protein
MESAASWDSSKDPGEPPKRVLKPWGVPMLSAEGSGCARPSGHERAEAEGGSGLAEGHDTPG